MKQLFWKEWRELRLLPLGTAILCLILQVGFCVMCLLRIGGNGAEDFTLSDVRGIAWGMWVFFAILAGSGLISQEIGNGTLSFLFALPTSRRQIWLVKVAGGVASFLLCILSTAIVAMIAGLAARADLLQGINSPSAILFSSDSADAILCAFGCFAVSIAVSPLLDRYISAAAVSVGICLIVAIVIAWGTTGYDMPYSPAGAVLQYRVDYAIVGLCIPLFTAISYWTFTHGETLRSLKRFYAAGHAVIIGSIAFVFLFAFVRSYVLANTPPAVQREETAYSQPPPAGRVSILRGTDSLGHEQYYVQLPSPSTSYRLVTDWKIDGGKVSGKSSRIVTGSDQIRMGAWVDGSEDTMVKSVLSAQGMAVPHPGDVTFDLNIVGAGDSFTPFTLHFKSGSRWSVNSSGMPANPMHAYKIGDKLIILDAVLTDSSAGGKFTDPERVPNDSSSEALFTSGIAHRVTVTATFEPAN